MFRKDDKSDEYKQLEARRALAIALIDAMDIVHDNTAPNEVKAAALAIKISEYINGFTENTTDENVLLLMQLAEALEERSANNG